MWVCSRFQVMERSEIQMLLR